MRQKRQSATVSAPTGCYNTRSTDFTKERFDGNVSEVQAADQTER